MPLWPMGSLPGGAHCARTPCPEGGIAQRLPVWHHSWQSCLCIFQGTCVPLKKGSEFPGAKNIHRQQGLYGELGMQSRRCNGTASSLSHRAQEQVMLPASLTEGNCC